MQWEVSTNWVRCNTKRSPRSKIRCEVLLQYTDEGGTTIALDHPRTQTNPDHLQHAGRGKVGQWFFWSTPPQS